MKQNGFHQISNQEKYIKKFGYFLDPAYTKQEYSGSYKMADNFSSLFFMSNHIYQSRCTSKPESETCFRPTILQS